MLYNKSNVAKVALLTNLDKDGIMKSYKGFPHQCDITIDHPDTEEEIDVTIWYDFSEDEPDVNWGGGVEDFAVLYRGEELDVNEATADYIREQVYQQHTE